jgi:hypothetical protein
MGRNRLTSAGPRGAFSVRSALSSFLALGGLGWRAWQDAHPPSSAMIRDDIVRGSDGRQYRRVVRVDRNAADRTVTTSVTFTDTVSGGVGRAAYTQSQHESVLSSYPRLQAFLFASGLRLGIKVPPPPFEEPLLSLPEPMRPGQKWTVRLVHTKNRSYSDGSGKAPEGAGLFVRPSQLKSLSNQDIYYGKGVSW